MAGSKGRTPRKGDGPAKKCGAAVIVFERFIYGTYIPVLLSLGMSEYPYWKFLFYDFVGIVLWAATFLSIGYFFGNEAIEFIVLIEKNLSVFLLFPVLFTLFWISSKKANGNQKGQNPANGPHKRSRGRF